MISDGILKALIQSRLDGDYFRRSLSIDRFVAFSIQKTIFFQSELRGLIDLLRKLTHIA